MNTLDKEQLIKPFLQKKIDADFESVQDKMVLYALSTLLDEIKNQEDAYRSIVGTIDSDMEFKAYSRKLANLVQLKEPSIWMKILSKSLSPAGVVAGTVVWGLPEQLKLAGGILSFMALAVSDGVTVDFNEQDAQLLYAISRLGSTFSKDKLQQEMTSLHQAHPDKFDVSDDLMHRSLKKFVKYRVLSDDTRDDIYLVVEKINFSDK